LIPQMLVEPLKYEVKQIPQLFKDLSFKVRNRFTLLISIDFEIILNIPL